MRGAKGIVVGRLKTFFSLPVTLGVAARNRREKDHSAHSPYAAIRVPVRGAVSLFMGNPATPPSLVASPAARVVAPESLRSPPLDLFRRQGQAADCPCRVGDGRPAGSTRFFRPHPGTMTWRGSG